ncbi:MAG: filamentous hemagglutinin N-terminal domain-containing protein [Burkholderiales bacterium]|nr:filamentous hemagglutinin N-terminal domain-containing protein [Burkholderiales bacterium]
MATSLVTGQTLANPTGAQVVSGNASFSQQGNVLTVTNSNGTIINWQNFSIGANEITRFIQQSSNSSVLNRITGQDPSAILGALQSNGRVFLINPNGIVFGQGAQVNVNGLIASTLNIANEDFLSGKMKFAVGDKAGDLKNQGNILTPNGGQVLLIAPNVENSGIITSPKGDVVLAAGHSVQLVDTANPDMLVMVSAPTHQALNLGQVIAQGGKIGIYGAMINQRGLVNANSAVVGENGKIVFKASGDTLLDAGSVTTATGEGSGGNIQVLGNRVGLLGDAKVDASGQSGGGTILIGGDYQGKNPTIQNASRTFVDSKVSLNADAVRNGNGGKVIVWGNDVARAYGRITARGGADGGDGGLVETSGHYLDVAGAWVSTKAPSGKTGTWLLDPFDITITDSPNSNGNFSATGTSLDWEVSGDPSNICASACGANSISAMLESNNVVIATGGTGGGTIKGNITVSSPVSWNSGTSLTLSANANIFINSAIDGKQGMLKLLTYGGVSQLASAPISVAKLAFKALGNVDLGAQNAVGEIAGQLGDSANANNYNFKLNNGTKDLNIGCVENFCGIMTQVSGIYDEAAPNGVIKLETGGVLTQSANAQLAGKAVLAKGGSVTLNASNVTGVISGEATSSTGNGFQYTSSNTISLIQSGITSAAGVQLTSSGRIETRPGAMIKGSSLKLNAQGGIGNPQGSTGGLVTQVASLTAHNSGSNDIVIANTGNLNLNNIQQINSSGNISIVNDGAVKQGVGTSVSTGGGNISLLTKNGDLTIEGSVNSTGGLVSLVGGLSTNNNLLITGSASVTTTANDINLYAGKNITVDPNATVQANGGTVNRFTSTTSTTSTTTTTSSTTSTTLSSTAACLANPSLAGCRQNGGSSVTNVTDSVVAGINSASRVSDSTSRSVTLGSGEANTLGANEGSESASSNDKDADSGKKAKGSGGSNKAGAKKNAGKKLYCN